MKKVILKKYPDAKEKLDSKGDVYISARYDTVIESLGEDAFTKQNEKQIKKDKTDGKDDEDKLDSVGAHAAMVANNKLQYLEIRKGVA